MWFDPFSFSSLSSRIGRHIGRRIGLRFAAASVFTLASVFSGPALSAAAELIMNDVPYYGTSPRAVAVMLDLARVGPNDVLYDLGSGDGRIVVSALKERGARRAVGIEVDPRLLGQSWYNAREAGVADRADFIEQDFFSTDLSPATVITMYLLPDANMRLRPKLLKLAAGTRLVSHDWDMEDWQPDARKEIPTPEKPIGLRKTSILMLWVVPARFAGHHHGVNQADRFDLSIEQKFQRVTTASATIDGERYRFEPATVDGPDLVLNGRSDSGRSVRLSAHKTGPAEAVSPIEWTLSMDGRSRTISTRVVD